MPLSMHQASAPVFIRGLTVLSTLLEKAAAHAAAARTDPAELINARASRRTCVRCPARCSAPATPPVRGAAPRRVEAPRFPDEETTFEQLQERIAATIAYLRDVPADRLDGAESRKVSLAFGDFERSSAATTTC